MLYFVAIIYNLNKVVDKPNFYFVIVIFSILQIIGGFFQTAGSLPLFTLYQSIKAGGTRVESNKLYIDEVMPLSPAAKAQLNAGDIIVSANGTGIGTPDDFINIVNKNKGTFINLVINRNGESKQVKLMPRIDSPPNEGPSGLVVSNSIFQKEPIFTLISNTLLQNISWDSSMTNKSEEAGPIGIFQQKEFFKPLVLVMGIILIILAIGLIKLKKWALIGMFIVTFRDIVNIVIYYLSLSKSQFNSSLLTSTILLLLSLLFVYYLYSQRKFFK